MSSTASKHSSGLDFSDRSDTFGQRPDFGTDVPQTTLLERNRTERRRLQGLQVHPATSSTYKGPIKPQSWRQKFDLWMINEGGKHLVFAAWIFLHLLVITIGFLNYKLKDNFNNARADFGITYGRFFFSGPFGF
jgi:hypothetical protein